MLAHMTNPRYQHLADAFNSIISMMLASLRAHGWRVLLDLPNIIVATIYLRRLGKQFAAFIANLGDLALLPPAVTPPAPQADCPQPDPTPRARPRAAAHPRAQRPRALAAIQPV